MKLYVRHQSSPIGILSLYANDIALVGLFFPNADRTRLGRDFQQAREEENEMLVRASEELQDYFAGRLKTFTVPVTASGTDFQEDVWRSLQDIPYGELRSYGDVARSIGRPKAVRAVGGAIGSNPVAIIIPCHRVIGANDTLTGFGGGLDTKETLLNIEGHLIEGSKISRSGSFRCVTP